MQRINVRKIKRIAQAVRLKLGRCDLACRLHADTLRDALVAAGYDAVRIYGHIQVDGNWAHVWGQQPVDWYTNDPTVDRNMDHNWVEISDALVVDTGAEQFNPLLRRARFPEVYLEHKSKALRHVGQEVVGAGYRRPT